MTPQRPPALLVLKIGGSLVSRRELLDDLDRERVAAYAAMVAELARQAAGVPVVLVVGGGSYGHGSVRHADPDRPADLVRLTEATARLRWAWVRALFEAGVPAVPVQVSALAARRRGRTLSWAAQTLAAARQDGFLPVLSGDVVLAGSGRLEVLGSDRVPRIVVDAGDPPAHRIRVAMLTDVEGLRDGGPTAALLPAIDPRRPQAAYGALWEPAAGDTTGGMRGKLDALVDLALDGVECVLLSGPAALAAPHLLLRPAGDWPPELAATRIARPAGP
ncbi:MAG: hypothetical protein JO144_04555 [Actinobacteria bacterium]|nr:hypothetical protein [Actinomycetota bacterium]